MLAFFWIAETEAPNLILMRILRLGFHWPPIKVVTAFTDKEEYQN
jgi:hypothetical protein